MKIFGLNNKFVKKSLILIFWLLLWEIVAGVIAAPVYFPSFINTLKAFIVLCKEVLFWQSVLTSFFRVVIGFIFAMIIGIILGIICSINSFINDFISFIMVTIKSTPVASFIIIALIWFESGTVPIFICFLMLLPVMFENIVAGVKSIDKKLIEVCKIYNVKTKDYILKVVIPSIKPFINAAMTASLGLGWKVCISAEVLSRPKLSIGSNIYDSKLYLETDKLFAWTLTVIILSFIFERMIIYFSSQGGK